MEKFHVPRIKLQSILSLSNEIVLVRDRTIKDSRTFDRSFLIEGALIAEYRLRKQIQIAVFDRVNITQSKNNLKITAS